MRLYLYYCTEELPQSRNSNRPKICGNVVVKLQPWDPGSDSNRPPLYKCEACGHVTEHEEIAGPFESFPFQFPDPGTHYAKFGHQARMRGVQQRNASSSYGSDP